MRSTQSTQKGAILFSSYPPSPSFRLSGNFRKAERQLLNLFVAKEYQNITNMLNSISRDIKENFFESYGYSILHYAIVSSNDTESLKVIMENIPINILQGLLRRNDFEILKNLARIKYSFENHMLPNQTQEEAVKSATLISQKIRYLSNIDEELLPDFLEEHTDERYMSESVRQMFRTVISVEIERAALN